MRVLFEGGVYSKKYGMCSTVPCIRSGKIFNFYTGLSYILILTHVLSLCFLQAIAVILVTLLYLLCIHKFRKEGLDEEPAISS